LFRIISSSFSIDIASVSANGVKLSPSPYVGLCVYVCDCVCLSVGLSVRKVYRGKTADWIQMPFGMVSMVDRGMGVSTMTFPLTLRYFQF